MTESAARLPPHRYRVYGLTVATWIPFPELDPAPVDGSVDVVFRLGRVPSDLEIAHDQGAFFQAAPSRLLSWTPSVARFLTIQGREVVVQMEPGAAERDVRTLILCSPMGAVLLQRGMLPLHASAVVTPFGAVGFMGKSGRGKSTLAAQFARSGFRVLADDVAAITFVEEGTPMVQPGLPQFKLWPNSASELGESVETLPRLLTQTEKRLLSFRNNFHSNPEPLIHLYNLNTVPDPGEIQLHPQPLFGRLELLKNHTYRGQYLSGLNLKQTHFRNISQVASRVPVTRILRPEESGFKLEALMNRVLADLEASQPSRRAQG